MSEHKATSDYPSGGYMQNADYTYAADSKPISMDNQINNGFDRTFKFDFAGRLTANSFGTVSSKTVYSQTINYTNDKAGRLTDVGGTTFEREGQACDSAIFDS